MNRCCETPSTSLPAAFLAAVLGLGLLGAHAAHAQSVQREFPAKALRGAMVIKEPPLLAMDDRLTRLAPGARILDTGNKLVRPASLVNQTLTVNYTVDLRGQIHQVWILSEAEARQKRAGFGVERNFSFESQQAAPAAGAKATTQTH